jgi:hypothetical protein
MLEQHDVVKSEHLAELVRQEHGRGGAIVARGSARDERRGVDPEDAVLEVARWEVARGVRRRRRVVRLERRALDDVVLVREAEPVEDEPSAAEVPGGGVFGGRRPAMTLYTVARADKRKQRNAMTLKCSETSRNAREPTRGSSESR